MLDTNDRASVHEQYDRASNTSNLSVDVDRRLAADVMIAAGWSPATLGGAIMRMHSEFSRPPRSGSKTDAILMLHQLKTLPSVAEALGSRALCWGMDDGFAKARAVIAWWLDRVCRKCSGRRMQMIAGTPSLSARVCPACRGSGEATLPHGEQGKRLATYMESCVADWHGAVKKNLANQRRARNKVIDTPAGRVIIAAEDGTGR